MSVGVTAATAAAIEARGVTTTYGSRPALRAVDASFGERRMTAVVGPSGCGKSTLLRALNRTLELVPGARLVAGRVLHRGADVYAQEARHVRQRLGLIAQRPVVFPMSIVENVLFGAVFHGHVARADRADYARAYLERVGLWDEVKDRLREPADGLSGGQQQRLCLARTLANRPDAILLDEPCSSLDPTATRRIEEHLVDLKREYPILIVTHNLAQARRTADDVAVMSDGAIVESGPATRVFEEPATEFAKDFLTGRIG
jgi:phosphate transport system ATP-binding protein